MEWLVGINLGGLLHEAHDVLLAAVLLLVVARLVALERARRDARRNRRR